MYEVNSSNKISTNNVKFIKLKKKRKKKKKPLTIVETFVGCGGSHLGFKANNFKTIFVNDIWEDSLKTLKVNNQQELKDEQIICSDITELVKRDLCKEFKIKKGSLSVLMGGVVCKGFSLAGVRNPFDIRNYLYISQLKLVEKLRPKLSIIENVPTMKNMKILVKKNVGPVSKELQIEVDDSVEPLCKQIDSVIEEHKTNRGKIIAVNKKLDKELSQEEKEVCVKLKKTLEENKLELAEQRKVLEKKLEKYKYRVIDDIKGRYHELGYRVRIKILKCSNYGGFTNRRRLFIVAIRNDITKEWKWPTITHSDTVDTLPNLQTVGDAFDLLDTDNINSKKNDPDNIPMNHKESTVEKFKLITNNSIGGFSSRGTSRRLSMDKPAPTLVPGHSSFQIHPTEHRSITVREGAIITGFPRDFKFIGSHSARCMQIGNAIPFHLANVIAKSAREFLI